MYCVYKEDIVSGRLRNIFIWKLSAKLKLLGFANEVLGAHPNAFNHMQT